MKLQGMVGHKMGLRAISQKFWFFHNGGIIRAKITFSSISQEPFDLILLIFHKNVSNNKWNKYTYQLSHKLSSKGGIYAQACPKIDQVMVQK